MVTYGKSLAGGLPVGVVCGRKDLMRRFRDDRPADVCFARGTFNSHPYVMTAMDEFLSRLASPNFNAVYQGLDETWNGRAEALNARLAEKICPSASAISPRSGWCNIPSRPATTGCFNTICAPKGWR